MSDFQKTLQPTADDVEAKVNISARLGMIQAALESSYGASTLSRQDAKLTILPAMKTGPALNIFGFKCGSAWLAAGKPYVMIPTTDYYKKGEKMPNGQIATTDGLALKWPAPFRVYDSWDASYRDWARLMQTPGYVAVGAVDALQNDDLEAFGVAMGKRYAPNQDYPNRLNARANEMGLA